MCYIYKQTYTEKVGSKRVVKTMSCEHKMIDLPLLQLDQFSDLKSYLIYYLKVNTLLNNVHSRMDSTKLSLFPTFSLQIHKSF